MTLCSRVAVVTASGLLLALGLTTGSVGAQSGPGADGRDQPLTVVGRDGRLVATIGEPGLYSQPAFSPDGTRVAVAKTDPGTQNTDIWVLTLADGQRARITSDSAPDTEPVWSPDGTALVFISRRAGAWSLYRTPSNGNGREELLYRHSGFGGISSLGWSADGTYLTFSDLINISGALYVLPLDDGGHTREVLRPPLFNARISPDGRLIAYPSNQSGRLEMYVRRFDASSGAPASPAGERQVSSGGAVGVAFWRRDGKELYYLAPGVGIMAADVTFVETIRTGTPKRLFKAPNAGAALRLASVSPDGQRFIFVVSPEPLAKQLTVLDDRGKTIGMIGKQGPYGQPSLSPDGSKVAVIYRDVETGNQDIWTFEMATGRHHAVTSDPFPDSAPIWSPGGKAIAFVSTRGDYTGVYRKAWDGSGREELLYQHTPGTPSVVLTDWSADGQVLLFHAGDILYALPMNGDRKAIEIARTEFSTVGGRFSPDRRYIAYLSDQSGRYELYIRPFAAATGAESGSAARQWQVSTDGAQGMIFWPQDGQEIQYLAADGSYMAASLTTTPALEVGRPRLLFRPPNQGSGGPYTAVDNAAQLKNMNLDGTRFVFVVR